MKIMLNEKKKVNKTILIVATCLFLLGLGCLIVKALSFEYVDAQGFLHESFFLLPVGFFFIFISFVIYIVVCIKHFINKKNK